MNTDSAIRFSFSEKFSKSLINSLLKLRGYFPFQNQVSVLASLNFLEIYDIYPFLKINFKEF